MNTFKVSYLASVCAAILTVSGCSEMPTDSKQAASVEHAEHTSEQHLFALNQVRLSASPFLHAQQTNVR